ncbi:MAG TPA: hypothetical protein VLA61_21880 [Ideonella sp.]|uniref:hypothetical protein n=1 Tax=Ideonella sp. TaxID=1929293 RepID=UPI002B680BAA|nr:hypothetical protein [Ideonella sp.]HSI50924.1 hypothetical protein [Ideonella sp.]
MSTQASRIATQPSLFAALRRRAAALWSAACALRARARERAEARRAHALLREMGTRELADLGIGPDQVDWFCRGEGR